MLDEKIFERLQKLKSLTSSPNPHEADTARRMVDELIAKHGVTDEDLDRFEASSSHEEPVGSGQESWKFRLATAVAQFFECDALRFTVGDKKKIRIVGPRDKTKNASKNFENALRDFETLKKIFSRVTGGVGVFDVGVGVEEVEDGLVDGMIERIKVSKAEERRDFELSLQGNEIVKVKPKKKIKREVIHSDAATVNYPDSFLYMIAFGLALERYSFFPE